MAMKNGSSLSKAKILSRLEDDAQYYGEFGKQFLSNSALSTLLSNPKEFNKETDTTLPMIHGRWLHTALLEPDKLDNFIIVDASTRNTKIYKEAVADYGATEPLILEHERENLVAMCNQLKDLAGDDIFFNDAVYERPAIGKIAGRWFKGKADIIRPGVKIIDIKSTADISKFERSAYNYGYNSQAYIYRKLFGLPMEFLVVDKITHQVGKFTCSEDFYESGENKAAAAVKEYNKFYGEDAYADAETYVIQREL
jgi:hypothetical protein